MMISRLMGLVLAAGLAFSVSVQAEEGDPTKGARIFKKCAACHKVDKKKNGIGPYLVGIIDRPAAAAEGYRYSKAMKNSGLTWNEETIFGFLEAPRKFLKGTRMAFPGLKKAQDRHDVIEYLKQATAAD